jgi:hypothetical protein
MARPAISSFAWLAAAALIGLSVQVAQARYTGGWSGLLAVGEESLGSVIAKEIPNVVVVDHVGHDGQATYGVALDPWIAQPPSEVPDATYRYRRILLPMLGSGFGFLGGEALLWSLTILNLGGFVLSAWAFSLIVRERGLPWWLPVIPLLNVGLFLSLQSTTPDAAGLGLAMLAMALAVKEKHLFAAFAAGGAALTKEVFVVVCASLGLLALIHLRRRSVALTYFAATGPALLWSAYLFARLEEGPATGGNLGLPFAGIFESLALWSSTSSRDRGFTALSIAILALAVLSLLRGGKSLWSYLLTPFVAIALVASRAVWHLGNNSLRTLAPLLPLALLLLFDSSDHVKRSRRNLPV